MVNVAQYIFYDYTITIKPLFILIHTLCFTFLITHKIRPCSKILQLPYLILVSKIQIPTAAPQTKATKRTNRNAGTVNVIIFEKYIIDNLMG